MSGQDAVLWHERNGDDLGATQALLMRPIHREQSEFQDIEVFDHPTFGRVLALDGTVQLSQADEFIYHEMAVHVPLCGRRRSRPARVLIVGGGDGGILREALRHPSVERVVMCEIDRRVVELSNAHVGVQGDYADPRVTLVIDDAIRYMRDAARAGERFELIVIDATDSTSPSKVLWTESFYSDVASCLSDDGVAVDSDIVTWGKGGARMSRDPCELGILEIARTGRIFRGVESYWSKVPLYPGGWFGFFLYTKDGATCREPASELRGRYYNPDVHRAAFALPTWWRRLLPARPCTPETAAQPAEARDP